ncbi:MAG: hypothetical protein OEZ43_05215 [Gammaproteobacteria bacterium]|nr:hypothetical protein [Gammaproteobacteria bacterium]
MKKKVYVSLLSGLFVACSPSPSTIDEPIATTQNVGKVLDVGYVYHGIDGNRLVTGTANLSTTTPIDIDLPARANWLAAVHSGNDSYWVAVLENGEAKAYKLSGSVATEVSLTPARVNKETQPVPVLQEDGTLALANVFAGASTYTSPVILDYATGKRAYIADNGDLVVNDGGNLQRLAINALGYARILVDEDQRVAVLTGPTLRYAHQVLGNEHENAASITIVETSPALKVLSKIDVPSNDVIEGNPLIWVDVDGDGQRELVTTVSNITQGARVVVYKEDGTVLSQSAPIGSAYRWRHQVAVAPFGGGTEQQLVSVYIPHLGPVLEYIDMTNGSRNTSNSTLNYSSHLQISLNLDKSLTGDFDGDGKLEILLLNRSSRAELAAFELGENGVAKDWALALNDEFTSNLAAVQLDNGAIVLGAGQNRQLLLWPSE